ALMQAPSASGQLLSKFRSGVARYFRFSSGKHGAQEGTRTLTPYGTRPSNVCVYQFHHLSIVKRGRRTKSNRTREVKQGNGKFVSGWGLAALAVGEALGEVGGEEAAAVDHAGVDLHERGAGIELLPGTLGVGDAADADDGE